jgi:hypothetical protein
MMSKSGRCCALTPTNDPGSPASGTDALRESIEWEGERLDFALESLSSDGADGHPDEDRHGTRISGVDGVITGISAPSLLNNPC